MCFSLRLRAAARASSLPQRDECTAAAYVNGAVTSDDDARRTGLKKRARVKEEQQAAGERVRGKNAGFLDEGWQYWNWAIRIFGAECPLLPPNNKWMTAVILFREGIMHR